MSEIIAKTRYAKTTARKLRAVAVLVKNKPAADSMTILQHTPQKAAGLLAKTIKSAIYNAINNFNFDKDGLVIKNIIVNEGPAITRYRAMARGSGSAYKRKTAHVTVILESKSEPKSTESKKDATDTKTATATKVKAKTNKTAAKKEAKPKGSKTTVSVKKRK